MRIRKISFIDNKLDLGIGIVIPCTINAGVLESTLPVMKVLDWDKGMHSKCFACVCVHLF